jgi:predicted kinase
VTPELVLFIGLQAAGKSSFYRNHFSGSHDLVSKDRFPNNRNPARRQRQLIEEALGAGRSIVVDNTNPTVADRAELIALAHSFGVAVIGYYFESRLAGCLERNRLREGKSRVPDVALYATRKRLCRPSFAEGFDRLHYVRLVADGLFEIHEWTAELSEDEAR